MWLSYPRVPCRPTCPVGANWDTWSLIHLTQVTFQHSDLGSCNHHTENKKQNCDPKPPTRHKPPQHCCLGCHKWKCNPRAWAASPIDGWWFWWRTRWTGWRCGCRKWTAMQITHQAKQALSSQYVYTKKISHFVIGHRGHKIGLHEALAIQMPATSCNDVMFV